MKRYYCTYFDSHYLLKGLTLYHSLVRHGGRFDLFVLCLDDQTYELVCELRLRNLRPLRLSDLEAFDPELAATKAGRSEFEYYLTCSPCLPLWLLKRFREINLITYLDADLYFFSNPAPVYKELATGSIAIIEHRSSPAFKPWAETNGIYNVGWVSFRRDASGLACLEWWRDRCLEWCFLRAEDGKFADQKYLDDWPQRFSGVVVLRHHGANVAPWNIANYDLGRNRHGGPTVDGHKVLFYHFHGFDLTSDCTLRATHEVYKLPDGALGLFYYPYIREYLRVAGALLMRKQTLASRIRASLDRTVAPQVVRLEGNGAEFPIRYAGWQLTMLHSRNILGGWGTTDSSTAFQI